MSASKMSANRRLALLDLAERYRKEFEAKPNNKSESAWKYKSAGIASFLELSLSAEASIVSLKKGRARAASREESEKIDEQIGMLERIRCQSADIVDMFKVIAKKRRSPDSTVLDGKMDLTPEELEKFKERDWNNDFDKDKIRKQPDLDLTPDHVTLIRKAWDIGTERIVLQTVIQLDGDVTTRMSESFAAKPNDTVLKIHNDSVAASANFWTSLVNLIGQIAGQGVKSILGIRSA
jgi:hypothetical protein